MDEILQDIFYIKRRNTEDTEGGDVLAGDSGIVLAAEEAP
jgi:hypothetical protein